MSGNTKSFGDLYPPSTYFYILLYSLSVFPPFSRVHDNSPATFSVVTIVTAYPPSPRVGTCVCELRDVAYWQSVHGLLVLQPHHLFFLPLSKTYTQNCTFSSRCRVSVSVCRRCVLHTLLQRMSPSNCAPNCSTYLKLFCKQRIVYMLIGATLRAKVEMSNCEMYLL